MDFQTPDNICELMAGLIPEWCMTALEPTEGEGKLRRSIEKRGLIVTAPKDFYLIDKTQRFDCVIMNPPFTPMSVGYQILNDCMTMTDDIIALMPWLTIINGEKRTRDIKEFGLVGITHLPRKTFKGSRVQCCVLQMKKGYKEPTIFKFY